MSCKNYIKKNLSTESLSLTDPLTISVLLAFTLFIPFASVRGIFEGLQGSSFEATVNSRDNLIVLFSTLALSFPMVFDLLLDLTSYTGDLEFLGFRVLSLVSMVTAAVVCLAAQGSPYAVSTTLVMYCWAFYVEFAVVLSLMHYLIPRFMTYRRTLLISLLFYLTFLLINLDAMPSLSYRALDVVYDVLFYSAVFLFGLILCGWVYSLHLRQLSSRVGLRQFVLGLEYEQKVTLVLVFSLVSIVAIFTLVLAFFTPQFPRTAYLDDTSKYMFEVSRMLMTVFTYVVPSRLFRAKLMESELDLTVKKEIVRWVQHELR